MINLDTNCAINIPPKNDIKLDKDEYILCEYKEKHIKNLFIQFIFAMVCIAVFIYTVISKDFADQSLFLKGLRCYFCYFLHVINIYFYCKFDPQRLICNKQKLNSF